MNKKIALSVVALSALTAGIFAISSVSAHFGNGVRNENTTQELAQKLGVDQDKVASAMDEIRQEHQTEMRKQMSDNLDKAVSDGVINADQKQKILDRQTENQQKREQERQENQQWAKDNGIDFSALRSYGVGMGGFGMHGGFGHRDAE